MRISPTHKFIFIAIEKTGTNSIRHCLNNFADTKPGDGINPHWPACKVRAHYFETPQSNFEDYFSFAFVRNPWARLVSWFEYFNREVNKHESGAPSEGGIPTGPARHPAYAQWKTYSMMDFATWLRREHAQNSHRLSYQRYYEDENGKPLLNFIGKTENLQEDFNIVCDKIGIPRQKLPHKNKTKHKHYSTYYDDDTRELVAEKYAKDIERFGYSFGD